MDAATEAGPAPIDSPIMLEDPATPTSAGTNFSPLNASSGLCNTRRPPRKSTLTQQQKNQKRQRATQDQLITLEVEFNKNPTPTALVREAIAQDINMTERSVQIWFQNRRAKIKNIARKSIENGEDCGSIPESMRRHLAMQAMETGKGFFPNTVGGPPAMGGFSNPNTSLNNDASSGKVVIQHFNCRSLSVGTWRRVGQTQMDLIIFYSPEKACVTYYINNDSAGYKIEYPFAWIKNINLLQSDTTNITDEHSQAPGELIVELNRPPKFYMDGSGSGGFYECSDFTEDQQASQIMVHHLGGPAKILASQLAKLVSLDSFQNRHLLNPALAISAPVSPIGNRPASQPNHLVHPQTHVGLFNEQPLGLMGPPAPRGHKRQRSRSVPAAIDFSMLRQPTAPFLIQHQQHQMANNNLTLPQTTPEANIFAPVPQHHIGNPFVAPINPNLSIDTSVSYGMDFRNLAGSISATTINTTSEFGTPAFYNGAVLPEAAHQASFGTPYSNGFLTVDAGAMIGTSNTPVSHHSQDPVIADQSPPFDGNSTDIFSTPDDHLLTDDPLTLDVTKTLHRTFRSPLADYTQTHYASTFADDSFDFQSPPPSSHKMDLPFRHTDQAGTYQTPTHQSQTQPQLTNDSGIAFASPHDQQMYHTPKENNTLLYHDNSMFHSPRHVPDTSAYQTPANASHDAQTFRTPMNHSHQQQYQLQNGQQANMTQYQTQHDDDAVRDDLTLQNYMQFGTIDPASLS